MAADTLPLLVFGWGNPSRGDDALGPLFVDAVAALALPDVECLTDFQLQIEHALDLKGRQRILFVDASATAEAPFHVGPVAALRDASFTSHAMSPNAVLQTYVDVEKAEPPPAWLLAIRGVDFELGSPLSEEADRHLAKALTWFKSWV
jgi:hydrogenase maturation protease